MFFHSISTGCQPVCEHRKKVAAMLGFLIVTLFTIAAGASISVLADSGLRGIRAYRRLNQPALQGRYGQTAMIKVEEYGLQSSQSEPRPRLVNRPRQPHRAIQAPRPRLHAAA